VRKLANSLLGVFYMSQKENKTTDEMYEAYKNKLNELTSGLVETNKADFMKLIAYHFAVTQPIFDEFADNIQSAIVKHVAKRK
jgi:hypothetical protein